MKLCKDCKHRAAGKTGKMVCGLTEHIEPVEGRKVSYTCASERSDGGYCGIEASNWEPRQVSELERGSP